MKTASLVASVALVGVLASSAAGLDARATRLYDQISPFGLSTPVAEWIAEEAARARVRNIRVGNTGGNYGISDSNGLIKIQDSAGGRSIRNLTHEIAHIGAGLKGGHDCRWIRYLTGMAVRFEERFGRGQKWGTHSLESYYSRYNLERCRR
jgi:hypothetical protein